MVARRLDRKLLFRDDEHQLEIHIRVPGGIDDRTIRTVSENAVALKLVVSNFERD